jgi:hypothetical protein
VAERRIGRGRLAMRRAAIALAFALWLGACATGGGTGASADFYGTAYYSDDWWYGGGAWCCVDYPGDIGPPGPHPEHPIALPPGEGAPRPENPIAKPPGESAAKADATQAAPSRSMPSPRPAAPMRGGGGGGRGGGGRR